MHQELEILQGLFEDDPNTHILDLDTLGTMPDKAHPQLTHGQYFWVKKYGVSPWAIARVKVLQGNRKFFCFTDGTVKPTRNVYASQEGQFEPPQ